jgi:hypothetical protein
VTVPDTRTKVWRASAPLEPAGLDDSLKELPRPRLFRGREELLRRPLFEDPAFVEKADAGREPGDEQDEGRDPALAHAATPVNCGMISLPYASSVSSAPLVIR